LLARPKATQIKHLKGAPLLGSLLALPNTHKHWIRLEGLVRNKH
jgi:hypothetical protein